MRRKLARWALEAFRISERHAARRVKVAIGTLRYRSRKVLDEFLRFYESWRERMFTSLRVSTVESAVATRGLACECQAHLPAVPGGRVDRANQATAEDPRRQRTMTTATAV